MGIRDEHHPDAVNMSCDESVKRLDDERWSARNAVLARASGLPDSEARHEHMLAVDHLCTHYEKRLAKLLRYAKTLAQTSIDMQRRLDAGDLGASEAADIEQLGDRMWSVMMAVAGVKDG